MSRLRQTAVGITAGLVWIACSPTEPCACPPSRTHAIVHGAAFTAEGTRTQAAVFVTASVDCLGGAESPRAFEGPLPTGPTGEYEAHLYSADAPHEACITVTGVRARAGVQDTAVVKGVYVSMVPDHREPQRLRIDLVF